MSRNDTTEAHALERAIHEAIRTIQLQLDDLRTAVERLRQLRHLAEDAEAEAEPRLPYDHRLVIEVGPCGRPEMV